MVHKHSDRYVSVTFMNGLVIIYIGAGKGKTTAAVGLAVRAAGAGKKVLFSQFVKSATKMKNGEWPPSSELSILKKIRGISVKVWGRGFVGILGDKKSRREHVQAAKAGLRELRKQIQSRKYDVVIADEFISAIEVKVLTQKQVLEMMKYARNKVEAFALTGHNKYNKLLAAADLVTDMKMIKHPYYKGRLAERGIDY
jgi:cob(I)alamin adenosyltransferase